MSKEKALWSKNDPDNFKDNSLYRNKHAEKTHLFRFPDSFKTSKK